MIESNWILKVDLQNQNKVREWLNSEASSQSALEVNGELLSVTLTSLDDAFRFRLQFDEQLVK